MAAANRLVLRIRDAVHDLSGGDVGRWVSPAEIAQVLKLSDIAVCHAALRRAADEGWLATSGGRDIQRVRITLEGIRVCRFDKPRSRRR